MELSEVLRYRYKSFFYREQFYKSFKRLMVLYVVIFVLIGAIFYERVSQPSLIFFAVSPGGQINQLTGYGYRQLDRIVLAEAAAQRRVMQAEALKARAAASNNPAASNTVVPMGTPQQGAPEQAAAPVPSGQVAPDQSAPNQAVQAGALNHE
jgi:hypothetical protein